MRINSTPGGYDELTRYVGTKYDVSDQLNYMNARYEDRARGRFISEDPMFRAPSGMNLSDPQSLNSYSYANNNPINLSDPSGNCPVCVLMGISAVVGVTSQAIQDYTTGQPIRWQNYVGAAAGGAVGSLAFLGATSIGLGPASLGIGGGVGGAVNSTISQSLQILSGDTDQYNLTDIGLQTAYGAGSAYLRVPKIAGVTAGRNSFSAVTSQIETKVSNGMISSLQVSTASKILTSDSIKGGAQAFQLGLGLNALSLVGIELQKIGFSASSIDNTLSNLQSLIPNK